MTAHYSLWVLSAGLQISMVWLILAGMAGMVIMYAAFALCSKHKEPADTAHKSAQHADKKNPDV